MTTQHRAPAVTGFGFSREMAGADYRAFRRWYDARCLLLTTRADRDATFGEPASEMRAGMSAMRALAA